VYKTYQSIAPGFLRSEGILDVRLDSAKATAQARGSPIHTDRFSSKNNKY
jgi:hypothetical protein